MSPQRANKYRAYLSALFNSLVNSEDVPRYPEDREPKYVPPIEDVLAVMAKCTPEQRDYLWVLAFTAARCGEIKQTKIEKRPA